MPFRLALRWIIIALIAVVLWVAYLYAAENADAKIQLLV